MRFKLIELRESQPEIVFVWNKWAPIKVNFLAWSLWLGRLPSKDNLIFRNVNLQSTSCDICGLDEESPEHVFGSCIITSQVWEAISQWCRISCFFFFSVTDLPILYQSLRGDMGWKLAVQLVFFMTFWGLWRNRNNAVFNSKRTSAKHLFEEIRYPSFLWIKNRSRNLTLSWGDWCDFNISCMF
uniref:uncharacterized protein LOC122604895 n=1 Tax=Erigeron canadensis TaxID=72917 RepID=UPI001CB9552E|nr:uncharacterized protein LOC122604895 [Erigeron canadensis]